MNEEQGTPEETSKPQEDTSKVFAGEGSLQSKEEFDNDKVDYYAVDNPKKGAETNIGDGEMRNEGTVGMGDLPEENRFANEGQTDEEDNG